MQELEIHITSDSIKIEGKGYKGGECIKDLEKLEKELKLHGIELGTKDQKLKPEYHASGQRSGVEVRGR